MTQIADAPWVRMTEMFGPDDAEEIEYSCPVCGSEQPEDFVFDRRGDIIGCSCCTHRKDAYEWTLEHREIHE